MTVGDSLLGQIVVDDDGVLSIVAEPFAAHKILSSADDHHRGWNDYRDPRLRRAW